MGKEGVEIEVVVKKNQYEEQGGRSSTHAHTHTHSITQRTSEASVILLGFPG